MDTTRRRAATLAIGTLATATAAAGVVTVFVRGGGNRPARTPEEAATRLFRASLAGNCGQLHALMTDEFRARLDNLYPDPRLSCAVLRGAPGATLESVRVAYRSGDRAVVVMTTRIPGEGGDGATALLFVHRGDRWLTDSESLDCAEPAGAETQDCATFAMP